MNAAGGQICARSRFWASLRVDGELSELEGALLDAHLARCPDCAAFAAGAELTTRALRSAPLASHPQIAVPVARPQRRLLLGIVAATLVVASALLGGTVNSVDRTHASPEAAPAVVGVASVETADQLRRLRRTLLVTSQWRLPRDLSGEAT